MRPLTRRRVALGAGLLAALPAGTRAASAGDGRLLALGAELRAAHAREMDAVRTLMRAEEARNGLEAERASATAAAAFDARTALMDDLAGTAAEGLAGLSVKAALVCRALEHGATGADRRVAESLLADVARLVPEATTEDQPRSYVQGEPLASP